jgi:hypothetical protein
MSMEMRTFFTGDVPDTAALTKAFEGLGFPISVVGPDYPLQGHKGYMPMLLRGQKSGAEFYLDDGREQIEEMIDPESLADLDPNFDRTISFRFGSRWDELICATCAVAALAKLLNGIVYEEQEGVLWPIDQAITEAKDLLEKPKPDWAKD